MKDCMAAIMQTRSTIHQGCCFGLHCRGISTVYPEGIYDLYALYELHLPYDRFKNPEDPADEGKVRSAYKYGLHRYSWPHLGKNYPTKVTLVDWSSMLYGLTAFKRGMSFFINRLQ